jgi:hypothetical protein
MLLVIKQIVLPVLSLQKIKNSASFLVAFVLGRRKIGHSKENSFISGDY